jgi:hypothetical protein
MEHLNEHHLLEYHSGELTDMEKRAIRAHLETCKECRINEKMLKRDLKKIIEVFPQEPDKVFWALYLPRLRERMERKEERNRGYIQQWATVVASLAVTIIMLVFLLGEGPSNKVEFNFEEWIAENLYDPWPRDLDETTFNYALNQAVNKEYPDYLPMSEDDMYYMLNNLNSEEVQMIYNKIKSETLF